MTKLLVFIGLFLFLGAITNMDRHSRTQLSKYTQKVYKEHWAILHQNPTLEEQKPRPIKGAVTAVLSERVLTYLGTKNLSRKLHQNKPRIAV